MPNQITSIPSPLDNSEIPTLEEKKKVCAVTFSAIQTALDLTEAGVTINRQPMIKRFGDWHKFLETTGGHKDAWDPQYGFIKEGTIFTTTTDGWCHSGTRPLGTYTQHEKPKVSGVIENGRKFILFERNGIAGAFNSSALPSGAAEVRMFEDGDIKVRDRGVKEEREPTHEELDEIWDIFEPIDSHLKMIKDRQEK